MVYVLSNGREFPTKQAAVRYFQAMLRRYKPGQIVATQDQADLMSLFERHPDAAEKLAFPVLDIKVILAEYGTKCFALVTEAGQIDISYTAPFKRAKSHYQAFCEATRRAIRPQIKAFREMALPCVCPVSGVELNEKNSHVDHVFPWTFSAWASGLYRSMPELRKAEFLWKEGPEFADPALSELVARLHMQESRLRLVHSSVNLRLGANP